MEGKGGKKGGGGKVSSQLGLEPRQLSVRSVISVWRVQLYIQRFNF